MFQLLNGHLHGVYLIHSSSKVHSTHYMLHTKLNFTSRDSFCWPCC